MENHEYFVIVLKILINLQFTLISFETDRVEEITKITNTFIV